MRHQGCVGWPAELLELLPSQIPSPARASSSAQAPCWSCDILNVPYELLRRLWRHKVMPNNTSSCVMSASRMAMAASASSSSSSEMPGWPAKSLPGSAVHCRRAGRAGHILALVRQHSAQDERLLQARQRKSLRLDVYDWRWSSTLEDPTVVGQPAPSLHQPQHGPWPMSSLS